MSLGHKLRNPKLKNFYRKEQKFDFEKLNKVECTTLKTIISILNSLTYALGTHVYICLTISTLVSKLRTYL